MFIDSVKTSSEPQFNLGNVRLYSIENTHTCTFTCLLALCHYFVKSTHWGKSKFTISSRSSRINVRPQKQSSSLSLLSSSTSKWSFAIITTSWIFSSDSFCLVISYWYSSFHSIRFIVYVRKKSRDPLAISGCHTMGLVLSFTTICFSQASNFTDLLLYLHTSSFQISIGNILESSHSTQHNNLWKFASTQKET